MNGVKKRGRDRAIKVSTQRMSRGRASKEAEVRQSERREKFQEMVEARRILC